MTRRIGRLATGLCPGFILVLGDEDGRTRSLVLSLRLDALVGDGGD